MTVEVKARLTLDTSDFKAGASATDQVAEQIDQKDARRQSQADARAQAATERATARAQATADREAKRSAEQEAKDQAATKRREERQQAEAQRAGERATRQAEQAQRLAQQTADKEKNLATQRASQLQFQLNDIFTGLTTGQSPLTVALQQGPQITQLYGGLGNILGAIPKTALAAGAALAFVGTTMAAGINSATESAARQRQFAIELAATGNAASVTADQLDELVKVEARRAGANRADTASALGTFAGNFNLASQQELAQALAIARDLARVQGQELPAAAADFNRSLDGTAAGARRLDQTYNILTASEQEQIRLLDEQGKKHEVVQIVLAATERRFKGLNEQGVSPTAKALNELGNAWATFADKVGKSWSAQAVMFVAAQTLKGAAMLVGGPPQLPGQKPSESGGLTQKDVDENRAQLADAEQRLAELRAKANQPIKSATIVSDIATAEKRVAELQSNIAYLQDQLKTTGASTATQQAQESANQAQRDVKSWQDLAASLNTIEGQRRQAQAKRDQLQAGVSSGLLSPEALKEAQEGIRQIDGQLYGLRTTSQKLQEDLDLEKKLSALPPHLAALERAEVQAYKAAREAGDTHDQARAKGEQARANAAQQQATATREQISLLGAEARAALETAAAYGTSRAAGLRAAALSAAQAAEEQGSIAPGTAGAVAQETLEKNAAATVAAAAEKNRAYQEEIEGLQRLASAEVVSSEAAREAERANRVAALAIELRAQAAASGSAAIAAAAEREIETYDRLSRQQLELDRRRAANQLNAQYDPQIAFDQQMAQLNALAETGQLTGRTVAEATRQFEQQRLDASRSATDGMIAGLRRYADEATNAGRAASDGIASGMRSAEDAVVQFATTGSINFNNFANSVLADLVRVATRQAITGPLASAAGSALSGAGSWLSNLFGSSGANIPGIGTGTGFTYHQGGLVGQHGTNPRELPLSAWAGARRYHTGGVVLGADEIPIIAKRNEEVLTESDPRHRRNLGSAEAGYGTVVFEVNVKHDGSANVQAQRGTGANGMPSLDIIISKVEEGIASKVGNTNGALYKAIAGTFGVRPVARF